MGEEIFAPNDGFQVLDFGYKELVDSLSCCVGKRSQL